MPAKSFDLRLLTPFVAAADSATYSAAAGELGMTSPVLLERIGRLERELGARLVERDGRDGRRVVLTPAGQRFLVEARRILDGARQISAALRAEPGVVRAFLVTAAAAGTELPTAIGRFVAEIPGMQLTMTEGTGAQALAALRRGEADVMFDYPIDAPPGMGYATWDRGPFVAVCGPTHRLAAESEVPWSALEGERVLVAAPGLVDGYNATLRAAFARADVRVKEMPAGPSSAQYLIPAVRRGNAIMVIASWSCPPLPPGLAYVRLTPVQEIEIGLTWNASTTSPAVRRFVDMVRSLAPVDTAHTECPTTGEPVS